MNDTDKIAAELFGRVGQILDMTDGAIANKLTHETLAQVCHEGLAGSNLAFGNLFSQVDFLCKKHHVSVADTIAIQRMRRESNRSGRPAPNEIRYNCRALALFISAVLDVKVPPELVGRIPPTDRPHENRQPVDYRCVRCIVQETDADGFTATIDQDADEKEVVVSLADDQRYLADLLRPGMQLNLIDVSAPALSRDRRARATAQVIIVEPDFLVDISSIARCFTDYGHHPLAYTVNRMAPSANSQAILLGNFAGKALDDIINGEGRYDWKETFKKSFKEKALEFCACEDLNRDENFKTAALSQTQNIRQIVAELFGEFHSAVFPSRTTVAYDRRQAVLEPSFVCERLGLQGRVDLMTGDMKLLVEQKAGKNFNIQRNRPNEYGSYQKEDHYVQLLLYYGVLRQNFHVGSHQTDIRLLYSKYPLPGGLVVVNFYQKLFREALRLRNAIVFREFDFALHGFGPALESLTPATLNENHIATPFFQRYVLPRLQAVTEPLRRLTAVERAYFNRMMTFVYREQLAAKVGRQEGVGNAVADLWNMPLAEKRETGNIYTGLTIVSAECGSDFSGIDLITLSVPDQGEDFLPNFRLGDLVYFYGYGKDAQPDVREALLYKGTLIEIRTDRIRLKLINGLNPRLRADRYAIEHGGSDVGTTAAVRSLHQLMTADSRRRQLLLGLRAPEADTAVRLTRTYHPNYDDIILQARQARDYFLVAGPPGTGKTSMALQFLVREALAVKPADEGILLMAYTNRAVDEICGMLADNGIDYIRIGGEYTCDERYRGRLLDSLVEAAPRLDEVRRLLLRTDVIVGTTSTLQNKSYLFSLKRFAVAMVDEASQLLEPNLVGLLTRCGKFILIGDHKQLPAVVQQDEGESAVTEPSLWAIGLENCRQSLFERLLRLERRAGRTRFIGILRRQGRMHPEVAAFSNRMFYREENLRPVPLPHQQEARLRYAVAPADAFDDLLSRQRVIYVPSAFCHEPTLSDKVNTEEAAIVADVLRRVYRFYGRKFDADKTVGVIVPYRNQIAMIRKRVERLGIPALERVSIDTVERYQGSQRDVIIYSFTIQQYYQLDFLTGNCFEENGRVIDRKLNVALTRARKQMIVTGNERLMKANRVFAELIRDIDEKQGTWRGYEAGV
ncbi:AAA family ATPase [Prevotella sp. A2931]|uniref:AAA family ATPase n=1 Tax=Prevotella illustrans TaxID=2800387 RepID=A0ABS3M4E7_9BACT|nr:MULTISPECIES: DEAD/DEAH box helicase [Prevotella]MBO1363054.1 AAA family ATPase [Prevotella illustrans]PTL26894.1 DNA helicase [Prevotella sp. oral taxon 820]